MSLVGYITAYLLDIAIGDPKWFPHPVRYIGRGINLLEKISLKVASAPIWKRGAGIITVVIVVSFTYLIAFFLVKAFYSINSLLGEAFSILIANTTLSINDLAKEAKGVFNALKQDSLTDARKSVSRIVGRDTNDLDENGVIRAAVESVAENTSDGIIAPLFYLAIGGPALALAYKAVNTLDSMIGYKNERYRDFGWAAARLDDIANYIPARITGVLIVVASFIINNIWARHRLAPTFALKIMFRDGKNHSSPNSGIPEAAMAGSLGVQLGGPSCYFGELKIKPTIGELKRELIAEDIKDSVRIMYAASLLAILLVLLLRYWV